MSIASVVVTHMSLQPPPIGTKSNTRDVAAVLTHRVLAMALEELRSEETRAYVSEHLVRPLLRTVVAESMPYAIAFTTVIIAILLMSALTLTLLTFSLRK